MVVMFQPFLFSYALLLHFYFNLPLAFFLLYLRQTLYRETDHAKDYHNMWRRQRQKRDARRSSRFLSREIRFSAVKKEEGRKEGRKKERVICRADSRLAEISIHRGGTRNEITHQIPATGYNLRANTFRGMRHRCRFLGSIVWVEEVRSWPISFIGLYVRLESTSQGEP